MKSILFLLVASLAAATANADILYVTNSGANTVSRVDESTGAITTFATGLNDPFGIVLAPNGNFYVANQANLAAGTISQITPNGVVTTFANIGNAPDGLAVDGQGNLYVVNFGSDTVSKIPTTGVNAGVVSAYASGFNEPTGIVLSPAGTLYVSEAVGEIYTVSSNGTLTLFASPGQNPTGMAVDAGSNLYVSGLSNGDIYKYASNGGAPATFATGFADPEGLVFDSSQNLVVMNLGNSNGSGSSSSEVTLLSSAGAFVKNVTGFTDPAYAVDLSGTATVSPSAGANGSISPNSPQTVAVGTSVNFTATPNNQFKVDQWLLNGVVAQMGGTSFSITNATPNATVEVSFVAAAPITPFPGLYAGLLSDNSGHVSINVSAKGQFTGKLVIGSVSHNLAGKFTSLGAFQGNASAGGGVVNLQLVAGQSGIPGSYSIIGSAHGVNVTAWHAAQESIYTLTLTAASSGAGIPQTSSTATLKMSATGSATLAGKLPDGEPFSAATTVVGGPSGNQCLFYAILNYQHASPASARGILLGSITLPSGVVTGPLLWTKPAQTKGAFPAAFSTGVTVTSQ